jgi:hypothetical protein
MTLDALFGTERSHSNLASMASKPNPQMFVKEKITKELKHSCQIP